MGRRLERESSPAVFIESWEYVRKSGRQMDPELFLEAGMTWYGEYRRHSGIHGVWVHQNAPQSPQLRDGKLGVFLAAPSNAGKDALGKYITEHCPGLICPVVTATDRPPRTNEVEGVDQRFLTTEEFQEWQRDGKFIESSQTRPPYWFGIPKESVQTAIDCGNIALFRINTEGVRSVRGIIEEKYFPTSRIAVIPKLTLEAYEQKLRASGKEHAETRIDTAKVELFRIGQEFDKYEYILENPWNADGIPHEAGESFHTLLHHLTGSTHLNPIEAPAA